MPDKVLYFPHIRVPDNEWFTRVLLYWDEVASIIPEDVLRKPEGLGTHMRDLLTEGLVRPVMPRDYVWEIPRFSDAFLDFVDGNATIQARPKGSLSRQPTFRVHMEKLGSIADGLVERGLARRSSDDPSYHIVEEFTARQFMAYLAAVLGSLEDLQLEPVTDRLDYLAAFSGDDASTQEAWTMLKHRVRADVLNDVLPAPAGGVSVGELSKFKSSNAELLRRFRIRIEKAILDTVTIDDPNGRAEHLDITKTELADEIDEIRSRMAEARWLHLIFGTLCSLFAVAGPPGVAIATQQEEVAPLALPGLINAMYQAFAGSPRQSRIGLRPLAYAAIAQKRFA